MMHPCFYSLTASRLLRLVAMLSRRQDSRQNARLVAKAQWRPEIIMGVLVILHVLNTRCIHSLRPPDLLQLH